MGLLYTEDLIHCIIYLKFVVSIDLCVVTIHTKISLVTEATEVYTNLIVVIMSHSI